LFVVSYDVTTYLTVICATEIRW